MSIVFIGGSRKISRLNAEMRKRLDGLMRSGLNVLIGDANGADKAVQTYLASKGFRGVILYCSGSECRNNVGHWPTEHIRTSPGAKGFEHYSAKDKAMASVADYGLFLWDGVSKGTFENIRRMVDQGKSSLVYVPHLGSFATVRTIADLQLLPAPSPSTSALRRGRPRRQQTPPGVRPLF
jgi:hypothetical protein